MADRPTLTKKGRQGEKIGNLYSFYFASRPIISRTTRLTKMVHLSKFAEFHKENSKSVFNIVGLKGIFSCFRNKKCIYFGLIRLHMYNNAFCFLLKYFLIGYLCNTTGHCFFLSGFLFFFFFFFFFLPTDRL